LAGQVSPPHGIAMQLIIRKAAVQWKVGAKGDTCVVNAGSGVLKDARYTSGIPFKDNSVTDPAELIAAAHAGSFSLALSKELKLAPSALGSILTTATVTTEHLATGWTITNIHLNVIATLPKVTQSQFIDATVRAKTSCLVSRLLRTTVSVNAKLGK
jgi:lipoyl-dependent peroxiredoxin